MYPFSSFTSVIFDLGDVLFSWSSQTKTAISSKTLRQILSSTTWQDYERGRLTETDCYECIGREFSLDPEEIKQAFIQARASLQANDDLILLIRELKAQSNGTLRVFAMSNISLPDYDVLRTKPADWSIFEEVFTSGEAGERKPNLGFYKYVLGKAGIEPHSTIFVDDKVENVLSARSLGLHGIVFDSHDRVKRSLRNLLGNPIARGKEFLARNAGHLESVTDTNVTLQENFAQLLILEATADRHLVNLVEHPRTWNFFHGKGQLTTAEFPCDLDTTSIALTTLDSDKGTIDSVMDEMLEYVDADGIIQTYFDHQRPRFDPVVCVNILTLFYKHGRTSQLQSTFQWVLEVLTNRAYLEGTRYYATPECFLYFFSRLINSTSDPVLLAKMEPLLKARVQERIGAEGDALALAMRILACDCVGIRDEVDLRALLPLQCEDGGWEIGWIYKYGSSGVQIGNRGLTTALAIKAVEVMSRPTHQPSYSPVPSPSPTVIAPSLKTRVGKRNSTIVENKPTTGFKPFERLSRSPLRLPLKWLWHGGRMRKPMEAGI